MESDSGLTPYELRVKRNIEENQRVLESLGLLNPILARKDSRIKKTVRRSNVAVKSRSSFRPNEDSPASPSLPARRTRRSSSILKSQGYDEFDDVPVAADEENTPPHKRKKIAPEPVFGPIEGVSVGDWWSTRIECSAAGVHRPTVAGIHGKLEEGCYSIALSGGYEDDIDCGEYFTYTGSGGRDLKGTKTNPKNLRTAPQTKDQVLEGPNAALALNIENRRPVRVIRGYKLPSPYAPEEGYRYDGLYSVEKCWTATGASGFKIYKYALKRIPGQDIPPWLTNVSIVPAQNGNSEPKQNGGLQEGNESEDYSNKQRSTSDLDENATRYLKSSSNYSPNFILNDVKDEDITITESKTQISQKRKRRSSDLMIGPEENIEKSISTESLNATENLSEGNHVTRKKSPIAPKQIMRLNNSRLSGTMQEAKSPTDSASSAQNASENEDESDQLKTSNYSPNFILNVAKDEDVAVTENKNQMSQKRKRTSSDLKIDPEENKSKSTESLNSTDYFSECNHVTTKNSPVASKKIRRLSNSRLSGTMQEAKSPTDSANSAQNASENKDETDKFKTSNYSPNFILKDEDITVIENKTQILQKRKRTSSGSEEKREKSKSSESLNSTENVSKGVNVAIKNSQIAQKKIRRSSNSSGNGAIQEAKSPSDSPSSPQNASENIDDTDQLKYTEYKGGVGTYQGSPISDCRVQLVPLSGKYVLDINSSQTDKTDQKDTESPNCNGKKVTFSPEVTFNDEEGKKYTGPITSLNCGNANSCRKLNYPINIWNSVEPIKIDYTQRNDQDMPQSPNNGKSKKQTSILKYFEPVMRIDEKRVSSRGILLRSNRRSFVSNSLMPVPESRSQNKNEKTNKSEQKQERSQNPASSPVKPCSVSLVRLNATKYTLTLAKDHVKMDKLGDPFIGWDFGIKEETFLGFDLGHEHLILFNGFEENSRTLTEYLLKLASVIKKIEALEEY